MIHELKTHPEPFEQVHSGSKPSEFRRNDRDFKVGDHLLLREWDPQRELYTGREVMSLVTCVTTGFGIPEGFAMLGMKVIARVPTLGGDS